MRSAYTLRSKRSRSPSNASSSESNEHSSDEEDTCALESQDSRPSKRICVAQTQAATESNSESESEAEPEPETEPEPEPEPELDPEPEAEERSKSTNEETAKTLQHNEKATAEEDARGRQAIKRETPQSSGAIAVEDDGKKALADHIDTFVDTLRDTIKQDVTAQIVQALQGRSADPIQTQQPLLLGSAFAVQTRIFMLKNMANFLKDSRDLLLEQIEELVDEDTREPTFTAQ